MPTAIKPLTIKHLRGTQTIRVVSNRPRDLAKALDELSCDRRVVVMSAAQPQELAPTIAETLAAIRPHTVIEIGAESPVKSLANVGLIAARLSDAKATRTSALIAVGGGEIADLAGFTASVYMRGITLIQIPTTLIGMGDAIIGKVAVDHHNHKNLLGSFYSPTLTWCDTRFLETLPDRQLAEGLVEIWKHSILADDETLEAAVQQALGQNLRADYAPVVERSLAVKKAHVEQDLHETEGPHTALSLGHTLANYLESQLEASHGAAVLVGMVHSAIISRNQSLISGEQFDRIVSTAKTLDRWLGILPIAGRLDSASVLAYLQHDKAFRNGACNYVIPAPGGYRIVKMSPQLFTGTLDQLKAVVR